MLWFTKDCGPCMGRGYYGLDFNDLCAICEGSGKVTLEGQPGDYKTCGPCMGRGYVGLEFKDTCRRCTGFGLIRHPSLVQESDRRTTNIEQVEECIREFNKLQSLRLPYHDERVHRAFRDAKDKIASVFGVNSQQLRDFEKTLTENPPPGKNPNPSVLYPQRAHEKLLAAILDLLVYFLRRLSPDSAAAYDAFEALAFNLHPRIASACANHFRSGEYRSAVVDACTALRDIVRELSGRGDLDGATLMQHVFSPDAPILAFSTGKTQLETDEQKGMMFLFTGAMTALRNPRAHTLTPDTVQEAIDYITLLNILAKQLMKAKRTT